ncbi:hypothetical protein E2C01_044831 [Portunus trituberculatus]|uniref:Uncharacterized protein n=1 Tax=Portunus trituberculatus TaxID=210409 RepID=A0A5B7G085_PORTR|nr:hypothetical protein [Portunus trituberculatus]
MSIFTCFLPTYNFHSRSIKKEHTFFFPLSLFFFSLLPSPPPPSRPHPPLRLLPPLRPHPPLFVFVLVILLFLDLTSAPPPPCSRLVPSNLDLRFQRSSSRRPAHEPCRCLRDAALSITCA